MGGDFTFLTWRFTYHIMENKLIFRGKVFPLFFVDRSGTLNLINVCCIFFFSCANPNCQPKKKKKKKKVIEGAARDTLLMRQSGVEDKWFPIARVRGLNACEGDVYPVIAASQ